MFCNNCCFVKRFRKHVSSGGRFCVRWCFATKNKKGALKSNVY